MSGLIAALVRLIDWGWEQVDRAIDIDWSWQDDPLCDRGDGDERGSA